MNTNFKSVSLLIVVIFVLFSSLSAESENLKLCMLKSLVLPGWGEISQGSNSGYFFVATELGFWATYLYFNNESKLFEEKYKQYCIQHAGVAPGEYDAQFYTDVSKYMSSGFEDGGYNQKIMIESMSAEDPEQYLEDNAYDDDHYWSWDTSENMHIYRKYKNDSQKFTDYAKAATGTFILNRIFSVINTVRVHKKNKRVDFSMSMNSNLKPYMNFAYSF